MDKPAPKYLAAVFFCSLLCALVAIFANPNFVTRGEGREALVVANMFRQQNFTLPLRNGSEIPSKPPLFHWIGAGTSNVFPNAPEFSIRFPSAITYALLITFCFGIFVPYLGTNWALAATIILASSMDMLRYSAIARVDMVFSLFIAVATFLLFGLAEKIRLGQPKTLTLTLAAISSALAVLAKGPAGLVLPWIVFCVYAASTLPLKRLPYIGMIYSGLLSVAAAGIWYWAAYQQGGQAFLDVHLMRENVARVVGVKGYETGHGGSPFTIIGLLFVALLPWSFFVPLVIGVAWQKRRSLREEDPLAFYSLIWGFFYLILFALTSSKRNVYLLPSLPAWAYLIAYAVKTGANNSFASGERLLKFALAAMQIISMVLVIAFVVVAFFIVSGIELNLLPLHMSANDWAFLTSVARELAHSKALIILLVPASLALSWSSLQLWRRKYLSGIIQTGIALILSTTLVRVVANPALSEVTSPKLFITDVMATLPKNAHVFLLEREYYAAAYYAGRDLPLISIADTEKLPPQTYVIGAKSDTLKIPSTVGFELISQSPRLDVYGRDHFVLFRIQ